MRLSKTLLYSLLASLLPAWFIVSAFGNKNEPASIVSSPKTAPNITEKISQKAAEAKLFVASHSFNPAVCFLVDMSLASGKNRFFVYDLSKDSVEMAGLVTHGSCNQNWLNGRKYGNSVGCGCTSLGKYRIGSSYTGRFGLAFKLYGLDNTNDKAYSRFVVLHSHSCVPETEIAEDICQSEGCPTVAPRFLEQLNSILVNSKRPVLLWIYQ